ncbi:MAG: site-2 protease family protein, partial [Gammaproteobacteria bacterium]|nr:site-2 protease family protein [Gammaproteobacteria bacterium]
MGELASILPLMFALVLGVVCHEWAHGYVAYRLGDATAYSEGRLTLNPIPHIDPFGTILMPALLAMTGAPVFGYAKPVPVVFQNLRNPLRDMVWVAAAGPAMNLALALGATIMLSIVKNSGLTGPTMVSVW